MEQIFVLLAVALVWLLVNIKAGANWLKMLSIVGLIAFLIAASWLAIRHVGLV